MINFADIFTKEHWLRCTIEQLEDAESRIVEKASTIEVGTERGNSAKHTVDKLLGLIRSAKEEVRQG